MCLLIIRTSSRVSSIEAARDAGPDCGRYGSVAVLTPRSVTDKEVVD
jgi:hypothetical protein